MTFSRTVGSTIGFTQIVGLTAEVSGGINLEIVKFDGKVTASGELSFSHAFSKVTTSTVRANDLSLPFDL